MVFIKKCKKYLYIYDNNIGALGAGLLAKNTNISKHNYEQKTMDLLNVL